MELQLMARIGLLFETCRTNKLIRTFISSTAGKWRNENGVRAEIPSNTNHFRIQNYLADTRISRKLSFFTPVKMSDR